MRNERKRHLDVSSAYPSMEVAGLVLAVVPMVSSAAKRWSITYRTSKTVLSQKSKDAVAVDDYRQINWDLALLDLHLRNFVQALPTLSDDEKVTLLEGELDLRTSAWTTTRIEQALFARLGSVDRREAVVDCLRAICEVLEAMISDRTLGLIKSDLVVRIHGRTSPQSQPLLIVATIRLQPTISHDRFIPNWRLSVKTLVAKAKASSSGFTSLLTRTAATEHGKISTSMSPRSKSW